MEIPDQIKVDRRDSNHADMYPNSRKNAAYSWLFFVVGRTGFYDRTYKDFQKSASDCIDDYCGQNSEKGMIHDFRKDR